MARSIKFKKSNKSNKNKKRTNSYPNINPRVEEPRVYPEALEGR